MLVQDDYDRNSGDDDDNDEDDDALMTMMMNDDANNEDSDDDFTPSRLPGELEGGERNLNRGFLS